MKGSSTVGESTTSSGPSFLLALAGGRAVLLDRTTRPGVLVLGRRRVFARPRLPVHLRLVTLIRGLLPFTFGSAGGAPPAGKYELRLRASRTGCTRTGSALAPDALAPDAAHSPGCTRTGSLCLLPRGREAGCPLRGQVGRGFSLGTGSEDYMVLGHHGY